MLEVRRSDVGSGDIAGIAPTIVDNHKSIRPPLALWHRCVTNNSADNLVICGGLSASETESCYN